MRLLLTRYIVVVMAVLAAGGIKSALALDVTVNASFPAPENQGILDSELNGLDDEGDQFSFGGFAPPIGHRNDPGAGVGNYVAVHQFVLPDRTAIGGGTPAVLVGATLKSFLFSNAAVEEQVGNLNLVGLNVNVIGTISETDFEAAIAARDAGGVSLIYDDIATPATPGGNFALPEPDLLPFIQSEGYVDNGFLKFAFVADQYPTSLMGSGQQSYRIRGANNSFFPMQLELTYFVIPEPSSGVLCGVVGVCAFIRPRRRPG